MRASLGVNPVQSLGTTLASVQGTLKPQLVSADALRRARCAVDHVPASVSDGLYLECRLGPMRPNVDVVALVTQSGASRLLRAFQRGDIPARIQTCGHWERIVELCTQWVKPCGRLREFVHHVWLEYDVDGSTAPHDSREARWPRCPGLFLCLGETPPSNYSPGAWRQRASDGLAALLGEGLSRGLTGSLRNCFENLSGNVYVPYVGVMFARSPQIFRLCLMNIETSAVSPFLNRMGWSGHDAVADLLRMAEMRIGARGVIGLMHVDLDLNGNVLSHVGFERALLRRDIQHSGRLSGADRRLLDTLVAAGLCTSEKRDGLQAWPGTSVLQLSHHTTPRTLARRVNHIKFVAGKVGSHDEPEAKGYLYMRTRSDRLKVEVGAGRDR